MKYILIEGEKVFYNELDLTYENAKVIDFKVARKNLEDMREVFNNNNIKFCIMYGTLLGAIREKNFIKHDIDIDTIVFDEEKFKLSIKEMIDYGFAIARYEEKTKTYSFIRDEVYIDVYIVEKINDISGKFFVKICGKIFPKKYLNKFENIVFLGKNYDVPRNPKKILKYLYGEDWMIPISNKPGKWEPSSILIINKMLEKVVPKKIYLKIKNIYRRLTR